ncbi:MAG: Gfo/Idh/MocA family oxidoreductase [Bacteroidia bacterium]|nr:Gfo/Idh/MocA family oxidoreductase [Bacteroidia bacterium]
MKSQINRRSFLKSTAAVGVTAGIAASPFQIFARGLPSKKVVVAIMGLRSRGHALAQNFAAQPDCEIACLVDVDDRYFEPAIEGMSQYQKKRPLLEKDIRKVVENKDIDAIVIAAPDHWHAPAAIMGCQAGKHVYVEKPCSHNPREGEWLVAASRKYNRLVQMGNQRRTWPNMQQCIREIHSGIIGRVYYSKGWYANNREPIGFGKKTAVPDYLNFDLWQGPAPRRPYQDNLHPYNWHWFWHWGTGESLNNGTHMLDLMRWGMQLDFPSRVVSTGGRYHYKDDWETPDTQVISFDFEEGKSMTWEGRSCNGYQPENTGAGVIFYGEGGTVVVRGNDTYTVYDNSSQAKIIKDVKQDDAPDQTTNTVGPGMRYDSPHIANFLSAIRDGKPLNSEIEGGFKSTLLCQLGNIAQRTGRVLNIDPRNGHIVGDPQAMELWGRTYEPGWEITV